MLDPSGRNAHEEAETVGAGHHNEDITRGWTATETVKDVMKMRQIQVRRRPRRPRATALDLRTPSGRQLPY
jgi:hypothetical protein